MDNRLKYITFIILLVCSLLSGCFYTTRSVLNAGVRSEFVSNEPPVSILMAEDGAIALKIKMVYLAPGIINSRRGTVTNTSLKYLVGSQSAVECSINNALKSDYTQRRRDEWKTRLPENVLYLTSFPYDLVEDKCGWKLIPSSFGGPDVTEDMLPGTFKTPKKVVYKGESFTLYKYHDVDYALVLTTWGARGSDSLRKEKQMWWGYPLRVFIIPAIPFDIITWPLQLLISPKFIDG